MYTFTLNRVRGRLSAGYRTQGITHSTWSVVGGRGGNNTNDVPQCESCNQSDIDFYACNHNPHPSKLITDLTKA